MFTNFQRMESLKKDQLKVDKMNEDSMSFLLSSIWRVKNMIKKRDENMSIDISNMRYNDVVLTAQQLNRAVAIKRAGSIIKLVIE